MAQTTMFKRGDVIVHPRRLEWGEGVIQQAISIVHEGKQAQRLVIDFANQGRVTINTAIAALLAREGASLMTTTPTVPDSPSTPPQVAAGKAGRGWLDSLEPGSNPLVKHHELWRLAEGLTDPFVSPAKRLAATLDTFRYGTDPHHARHILEWAIVQTGLNDPLGKYTRHELEQGFVRFQRDRDNHLADLVRTLKRGGQNDILNEALRTAADPVVRDALQRALHR